MASRAGHREGVLLGGPVFCLLGAFLSKCFEELILSCVLISPNNRFHTRIMSTSIAKLVSAIIDGEIHRFSEVVRRFDTRVRQVIAHQVVDPASREDLVQETFYRAFTKLDKLRDAEQLESWLVVIARNCVRDHFRKTNRKERCGLTIEAVDPATRPRSWVWQEVDRLPPQFGTVLRLRYLRSMSYAEIASHLQVNESTVRGRIFEARKALRQRLTDNGLFP